MNKLAVTTMIRAFMMLASYDVLVGCENHEEDINFCEPSRLFNGYIVGFVQCSAYNGDYGRGLAVSILSPPDTFVTYNFPDSLYHFPKEITASPLYENFKADFLFPPQYKNQFPISISYEPVPESQRVVNVCPDDVITGHLAGATQQRQISIKCAFKTFH